MKHLTDKELVQAFKKGYLSANKRLQRNAFSEIYRRYFQAIWVFAYKKTSKKNAADDFVQDTFERAFKGLPKLQREDLLRGWLFRIARNLVYSYYRKKGRQSPIIEIDKFDSENGAGFVRSDLNTPEDEIRSIENQLIIKAQIKTLSNREKRILELHYKEEKDHNQISVELGISYKTVCSTLSNARKKLMKKLKKVGLM